MLDEKVEDPNEVELVEEVEVPQNGYTSMTITELKAIAKDVGVENYSRLKKDELIEKLV